MRERDAFQELNYRAVFGSIAKWATEIDDPARIPELVSRAFYTATSGRPGPVVVALPEDMLTERVAVPDAPAFEPVEIWPGLADMAKLQKMLWAAKQPIVLAGGSRWSEAACATLARFAERFDMPVATTFRRGHLMDWRHPSYAGDLGIGPNPKLLARVKAADLIVLIGGRLGEMPSQSYSLLDIPGPRQTFVHVHPGAEELGRVYRPHLAINAAPTGFAAALEGLQPPNEISWREQTKPAHADYIAWTEKATPQPGAVNFGEIIVWLREHCRTRSSATAPATSPPGRSASSASASSASTSRRCAGSMGYGLPAAVGIKRALPRSHRAVRRRRRRFPDERPGVRDRRAIRPADHRRDHGQRHLRHHPHAPGARVSDPRGRHRAAQSGFRGLCQGVRRLRRDGGEDRGFRRGLRGCGEIRQARDHPRQGRHQRDRRR